MIKRIWKSLLFGFLLTSLGIGGMCGLYYFIKWLHSLGNRASCLVGVGLIFLLLSIVNFIFYEGWNKEEEAQ